MARWVNVTWAIVAWASDFVGGGEPQVQRGKGRGSTRALAAGNIYHLTYVPMCHILRGGLSGCLVGLALGAMGLRMRLPAQCQQFRQGR